MYYLIKQAQLPTLHLSSTHFLQIITLASDSYGGGEAVSAFSLEGAGLDKK